MTNMDFLEFLTLLIIGLITTSIVHYGIRYRALQGMDGFFWKLVFSWVFAWLGSPVLGHWFAGLSVQNVYLIPAILGGFAGAFCAAAIWKGIAVAIPQRSTT